MFVPPLIEVYFKLNWWLFAADDCVFVDTEGGTLLFRGKPSVFMQCAASSFKQSVFRPTLQDRIRLKSIKSIEKFLPQMEKED